MTLSRRVLPWVSGSALVLLLVLWSVRSGVSVGPWEDTTVPQVPDSSAAPGTPAETDVAEPGAARRAVSGEVASAEARAADEVEVDGDCTLTLEFSDPGGDPETVSAGTLRASWAGLAGGRRELVLRAADSCVLAHLPAATVVIDVEAEGLRHRPQTFELRAENPATEERVVLWPEHWIAVIVRDERGRPFTSLASDRGIDPRRWFVQAFDVRARRAHVEGLHLSLIHI